MKRESLGLYIFKLLIMCAIFFMICMLYWSSVLLEQDMKGVQQNLEKIESQFSDLKSKIASNAFAEKQVQESSKNDQKETKGITLAGRKHIDPSLPNLLSDDPFYELTLPKLLGKDFRPHSDLKFASLTKPENLHPFTAWAEVSAWTNLCNVSVATGKFGYNETFAPDMAIKMELRHNKDGVPEFWIHLRDNVFYEPLRKDLFSEDIKLSPWFLKKHQVTAHDFKFCLDAIMNPHVQEGGAVSSRSYLGDIDELRVIDDVTFVVRWKALPFKESDGKTILQMKYIAKLWTGALRPLAAFVYQYFPDGTKIVEDDSSKDVYRTSSIFAQNLSRHFAKNIIVSCGPWIFDGMTERQIQFKRNPNFYNPLAALTETRVYEFKQSAESIWQDFKSNNLDYYGIRSDQLIEYENFLKTDQYQEQLKKGDGIERLDFLARAAVHIQWNEARVFFKSKKVRQALTMAIDRQRIIKQNLNGMGIEITGPFFKYSKAYDDSIKPWPFDPRRAKALLEEEGWYDSDGDGIIDKEIDGKRVPFRFYLTYYVKNSTGRAICEFIATSLKDVGIDCQLNGIDIADLSAAFEDKNFDALFFIWGQGSSPEDPEQLWSSALAKLKGSSNSIGFANTEVDEIIKKLKMEYNEDERIKLYHRFDRIIHDEAPYTFLYTPKSSLLYRQYLQNVFIPADRQDILPGADVQEPDNSIYWIKKHDV